MPTPSFVRALALLSLAAGLASPRLFAEQPLPQPPLGLLERPLDEGWRFSLGENPGAQEPGYDDSGWRRVDLPHDWSIEARPGVPFHDPNTPDGVSVGYLHGGTGWYRKHFTVQKADAGREFEVVFDGVQQDADVWINGSYLGFQPHGYIGFHYALSGHLNPPGADNVIVVRALDPESNTRWYA
jgi:beta-galactosidase